MVAAKPMPMKVRAGVGFSSAVTMPITSPSIEISGPPELPGFTAASNWIRPVITCLPCGERKLRSRPETTPAEVDGPMPNGKPIATTSSPGRRFDVEPSVAASRSSGIFFARITARSFSG